MKVPPRSHPLWLAFLLHRLSGLALALFLPVHLWLLSQAVSSPATLDGFLAFAEHPLVKLAEFGLVFLLAVHMAGGLRLLVLEFLPWSDRHKTYAAAAIGAALFLSGTFFLRAI
jgi:fumarate reductase subunit D